MLKGKSNPTHTKKHHPNLTQQHSHGYSTRLPKAHINKLSRQRQQNLIHKQTKANFGQKVKKIATFSSSLKPLDMPSSSNLHIQTPHSNTMLNIVQQSSLHGYSVQTKSLANNTHSNRSFGTQNNNKSGTRQKQQQKHQYTNHNDNTSNIPIKNSSIISSINTPSFPSPFTTKNPLYTQKRTFLNAMFEKQRKMSWVLHRRKKMEMSADMLSRPTYRPARTESMDLIQKRIHDITLGDDNLAVGDLSLKTYDTTTHTTNKEEVPINLNKLNFRQTLRVLALKMKSNAPWFLSIYGSLWFAQFGSLMYKFKTVPETRFKYMNMLDMSAFQSMRHVIDTSPNWTDGLIAFGITTASDLIRFPACLAITALYFVRPGQVQVENNTDYNDVNWVKNNPGKIYNHEDVAHRAEMAKLNEKNLPKHHWYITLPPEEYQRVRYRYHLESPPPVEFDMSKIDPNLHIGLVNLPGTDPIPRHDFYGRDRQRDLIPKGRVDLEFVLYSWQRTNAVRRRREAIVRRRKPRKKKITGPRWAKVGQGIFTRNAM